MQRRWRIQSKSLLLQEKLTSIDWHLPVIHTNIIIIVVFYCCQRGQTLSRTTNWTNNGENEANSWLVPLQIPCRIPANRGDKSIWLIEYPAIVPAWNALPSAIIMTEVVWLLATYASNSRQTSDPYNAIHFSVFMCYANISRYSYLLRGKFFLNLLLRYSLYERDSQTKVLLMLP